MCALRVRGVHGVGAWCGTHTHYNDQYKNTWRPFYVASPGNLSPEKETLSIGWCPYQLLSLPAVQDRRPGAGRTWLGPRSCGSAPVLARRPLRHSAHCLAHLSACLQSCSRPCPGSRLKPLSTRHMTRYTARHPALHIALCPVRHPAYCIAHCPACPQPRPQPLSARCLSHCLARPSTSPRVCARTICRVTIPSKNWLGVTTSPANVC